MIDNSTVKRLAIQCGLEYRRHGNLGSTYEFDNDQLQAFAQAVIENFISEQKPLAWLNDKTPSGIFARHQEGADNFGCTVPLYALENKND